MSDPKPDEFFFSPDIGKFVLRNGHMYTEYGEAVPYDNTVRLVSASAESFENYADWSEEHRREVHAAFEKESRQREAAKQEERARRDLLVEQARGKLTPEEFEAICDQVIELARGY